MEDRTRSENLLSSHSWLDDLPEPILLHILSLLPSEDAMRTSVLARKWRYLWTCMPAFKIVDFSTPKSDGLIKIMERAFAFRDSSLSLSALDLRSWLLDKDDVVIVNSWINASLRHDVRRLLLTLSYEVEQPFYEPPSRIFHNAAFMELDLELQSQFRSVRGCFIRLPSTFCLPNLKILRFTSIRFVDDDGSIHRLLSLGSLQVLEIRDCRFLNIKALHISAANLRELVITENKSQVLIHGCSSLINFVYHGVPIVYYCASSSSLLTTAQVHITKPSKPSDERRREQTHHCLHNLLKEFSSVKSLWFSHHAVEAPPRGIKLLHQLPVFQNLSELCIFNFDENFGLEVFLAVLRRMPRLEKLHLYVIESSANCETNDGILEPIPSCIQSHLKKIRISKFIASKEALFVVKTLLGAAEVLEEMVLPLIIPNMAISEDENEVLRQLNEFPRASKNCKIAVY